MKGRENDDRGGRIVGREDQQLRESAFAKALTRSLRPFEIAAKLLSALDNVQISLYQDDCHLLAILIFSATFFHARNSNLMTLRSVNYFDTVTLMALDELSSTRWFFCMKFLIEFSSLL